MGWKWLLDTTGFSMTYRSVRMGINKHPSVRDKSEVLEKEVLDTRGAKKVGWL